MTRLVFDVGGTQTRAAIYSETSNRLERVLRVPTPGATNGDLSGNPTGWATLMQTLLHAGQAVLDGREPSAVCVAFPGPIDQHGHLLAAPTIWGVRGTPTYPLREKLTELWPQSRVYVLNDVSAAGYRFLSSELREFCILTVSSGIGHKVFIDGRPVLGTGGRGGEIGHLRIDFSPDALQCECGAFGHLGAIASGRGVEAAARRLARREPQRFARSVLRDSDVTTHALAAAFRSGDEWATEVIEAASVSLGRAIGAIHTAVGVERYVLIGGFAIALGERYRDQVARAAEQSCWNLGVQWDSSVVIGCADDDSGLLGAGRFLMEGDEHGRRRS